jgi:phosphonopyruvate decarboxylase
MKLDFLKGFEFFTGVPDSQLKPLCDYLMSTYGIGERHVIAANEGNAVALAAGYHLATGKVPVVYMQNSGIGNIINPVASLMNDKVYGIPCVFIVGWRGEPGIHDEPQHIYQGEVTVKLLEDMDIATFVIGKDTTEEVLAEKMAEFKKLLAIGKQVAFVVRKGALEFDGKVKYANENQMVREDIIRHIVAATGEDVIVSTTGKASRELFEIREANGQPHGMIS